MITQSELLIANLAAKHFIPKRVTNSVIETVKRANFNPANIRFNSIKQIHHLIAKAQGGGKYKSSIFGRKRMENRSSFSW